MTMRSTHFARTDFGMCTSVLLAIAFLIGLIGQAAGVEPPITDLAFTPDGKSVVATSQLGVQQFGWPGLEHLRTMKSASANLQCLAFSPNGERLAVGGGHPAEEGIVEVAAWPSGDPIASITEHTDSVMAVAWLDDDRILSAGMDRQIQEYDLEKRKVAGLFEGHSRGVSSLSLLKDSILVSSGDDQSVRVWNTSTRELVRSLSQHTQPIHALARRPGKGGLPMVASAAADRTIRFWQPSIGRMVRYARLDAKPLKAAWTIDGSHIIAVCVDGKVRVVDPFEVKVTTEFPVVDGWAYAIAVHPGDGSFVVGGANGTVKRIVVPASGP